MPTAMGGPGPQVGDPLPAVAMTITQETIDRYARASGDFNPIHVDPAFAQRSPFGGTIAHGLLSLAFLSQMMHQWAGEAWPGGGELEVRFLRPVRPGETVTATGEVVAVTPVAGDRCEVQCAVRCVNQNGQEVIAGQATVRRPG